MWHQDIVVFQERRRVSVSAPSVISFSDQSAELSTSPTRRSRVAATAQKETHLLKCAFACSTDRTQIKNKQSKPHVNHCAVLCLLRRRCRRPLEEPQFKIQLPVSHKTPSNHNWNKTVHSVLFAALFRFYWRDDEIPLQEKLGESGNKSWSLEKQNKTNEKHNSHVEMRHSSVNWHWQQLKYIHGVRKYALPRKCHTGATPPLSLWLKSPQFLFFNLPKRFSGRRNTRRWEKKWYEITLFWWGDSIFLFSVAVKVTDWGCSLLKRHAVRLTGGALGGKTHIGHKANSISHPLPNPPPPVLTHNFALHRTPLACIHIVNK